MCLAYDFFYIRQTGLVLHYGFGELRLEVIHQKVIEVDESLARITCLNLFLIINTSSHCRNLQASKKLKSCEIITPFATNVEMDY